MKLLTKEIKRKLPKLGATDGMGDAAPVICKFFAPVGSWTWYVTEGEKQEDGDWMFFGLVDGFEKELGYFVLSELESVKLQFGLGIERDIHFGEHQVGEFR